MADLPDAAIRQLIAKAQIVSFATWQSLYSPEAIAIFQLANDERRYLSDVDLEQLQAMDAAFTAESFAIVRLLRDRAPEIVSEARTSVLEGFPGLTEPGGGLYPEFRAQACWRDFWHFLRCITYGIAGGQRQYTSADGLHHMQLLYEALHVPLDAMVSGLEGLKVASLARLPEEQKVTCAPCFDVLQTALEQFRDGAKSAELDTLELGT